MDKSEASVTSYQLIALWKYVEQILSVYQIEEFEPSNINDPWMKRVAYSVRFENKKRQYWYWYILEGIFKSLNKKAYIKGDFFNKKSNLERVIHLLSSYGWSYQSGYVYDMDGIFDYHDDLVNLKEWFSYIMLHIKGKNKQSIIEALEKYYESLYIWDEPNLYHANDLSVRYIVLKKRVGIINSDYQEIFMFYARKLRSIHNYGQDAFVNITNGVLTVSIIVSSIYYNEYSIDYVWGDGYMEPYVGLLLEVIERILKISREDSGEDMLLKLERGVYE